MNHKFWNIVSTERYILHTQMLLECCYLSLIVNFVLDPLSLSISRCKSRYETDMDIYMYAVYFIAGSMRYMRFVT